MVACLNHGNSAKGTNSSSSFSSSQKPFLEMWVTSAAEVLVPGIVDLLKMPIDDPLGVSELACRQAGLRRQFDSRREPEFRLAVGMRHVHMHSRLFARKEEEPIRTVADN